MDLQLHDKRALVTGSTGAIGEATARTLANEGATVVVHGRKPDAAAAIAQSINSSGGSAIASAADLSVESDILRLIDDLRTSIDGIDILVNNAGGYSNATWWTASPRTGWSTTRRTSCPAFD